MYSCLNEREKKLLDLLLAIPPKMDDAECYLQAEGLKGKEITKVAIEYTEYCFCEAGDFAYEQGIPHPPDIIPNLHSTYIFDVIQLLLQNGLDPNDIFEDQNVMSNLEYVDNEFLAADTLALLLEHGGKIDRILPDTAETLSQTIEFDVFNDAIEQRDRQRYAALVHCWMVLIGYGAQYTEDSIQTFTEHHPWKMFDLRKLRNHRNYYFGVMQLENRVAISIYDKKTLCEVARLQ